MSSNVGLSTAGAITVRNEKGQLSMQKVKVQRYVSGRRPKYAERSSSESESESEDEFIIDKVKRKDNDNDEENVQILRNDSIISISEETIKTDRRLQRLNRRDNDVDRKNHSRQISEPEVITVKNSDLEHERYRPKRDVINYDSDKDDDNENEDDEENIERRHAILRKKQEENNRDEELLKREDDRDDEAADEEEDDEEDESEYEEYTDSEDETGPRLKPVFVRKKDRITIKEKEIEDMKAKEIELETKLNAEERHRQALKIIEDEVKREQEEKENDEQQLIASIAAVNTDDENEETAYELWKLRELKRIKRDKDEREAMVKERQEVERLRNMTEEERQAELRNNPKKITNQAEKGKYKFLQKYYHRGAFFLDEENDVFKRDFAQPTLEDHFDKTILPKVMQVKNFGRSGRTKYTHLVDQDTTAFDSPWTNESAQTSKFLNTQAGGMKQHFEKPTKKRK